ncbi:SPIRAL1-like protein 5 [Tanacetum coccineum]
MSERRSSGQGQSTLGYLFGESDELGKKDNDQYKVSSISGGGPSSLGYLFGSNALEQQRSQESKLSTRSVCVPPYGTDDVKENSPDKPLGPPSKDDDHNSLPLDTSYVYHKVDGENTKDFLMTGRPSIRVTSVPGGDSSVGYLFGDK